MLQNGTIYKFFHFVYSFEKYIYIYMVIWLVMDYLLGIKWPMQNEPAKNMNFNSHNIDELE